MKIKISEIKIERSDKDKRRFRTDFGSIQEMRDSIEKHGLIHPIVVVEAEDPPYKYQLIAGERRITAALYLGWTEIDATLKENLSDVQKKEIELEENIQRKDVTWEEKIEALRQLDDLKRKEYGSKQAGHGDVGTNKWTMKDTAASVGASVGKVCQDIKMARELNEHPELRSLVSGTTKQVARKTIEREIRAEELRRRIDRHDIVIGANFVHGRAEEEIKKIKTGSIQCLITDPPFGIEAIMDVSKGNLSSDYAGESNVGEMENMKSVYKILLPELHRVMIPGAHFYMFLGPDFFEILKTMFRENGFLVDPVPLIWSKGRTSMIPNPYHYIPSYEMILFGCKAPRTRTLLKPVANCMRDYPADAPQMRVHPLQKPKGLIKLFIGNSTSPGENVMDCFAGSGIVLKTALEMNRGAVGFEKDEKNYLMAMRFIEGREE